MSEDALGAIMNWFVSFSIKKKFLQRYSFVNVCKDCVTLIAKYELNS